MNDNYQGEAIILALGFFDGVHLGHLSLLKEAVRIGKEKKYKTGVMTFSAHPLELIFPNYTPWLITTNDEKRRMIHAAGIDYVFLNAFNERLMKLSPEKFVTDYLLKRYNIKGLVVGYNYNFGYKATGTTNTLKELGRIYDFNVTIVAPCVIDKHPVSSTFIRELISCGQVEEVKTYLGRYYQLSGQVIRGKGLGHQFGIPTANIKLDKKRILPNTGVYFTKVTYQGKSYDGLTNLGFNPTFEKHPFSIETYIYDFDDEIYGHELSLQFIRKVRNEIKFDNIEDLIAQIRSDIVLIDEKFRHRVDWQV
ncbi:MAG: riboflavin kinase / adenylyltransferase [Eubacteriaceae bacterium]|nr:riboflavin kinase / adenylyltransferase [Eubacteriaceae bacterium]MDK2935197.1 riboflavin kinase / adenylyltransferase [Eubacteriaceae bacterium]